ncbi:MAG TPA: beta-ketoacyl synthase chain length factor [Burkholderiaceae bacterium]|nr:beta-ketoacyl synthase chain length factor [Burkholderiaceae bacterium]
MNAAFAIESIGVVAPGMADWAQARAVLRREAPASDAPASIPAPMRLPAAERRRVGVPVRLALAAAEQIFGARGVEPRDARAVFASSGADGDVCHALCDALAGSDRQISPTRFTNSVHNAPAGYWAIAAGSTAPASSLCAHDASFGAGLLEAIGYLADGDAPVALIAYDAPYPFPLSRARPLGPPMAVALLLAANAGPASLATVQLEGLGDGAAQPLDDAVLEQLHRSVPAARSLPLLAAVARGADARVTLDLTDGQAMTLRVLPCG